MTTQRTDSHHRLGSLGSGAVTALGLAVQQGLAALVGVLIARKFGRDAETDGFFAAYAVFVVVVLAANAIRVVVLPPLARARAERKLGAEVAAYALTLATIVVPLLVLVLVADRPLSWLLTGNGTDEARDAAESVLPWLVLAAVLQLTAGLAASTLAALDEYVAPAAGYALGSVVGLAYILLRVDTVGIESVAQGMALNGAIAVLVPLTWLARRALAEAVPVEAMRPSELALGPRVAELSRGIAVPFALQAIYLVCVPLAGREGIGAVTSFGYAFLIASALVAVTGSSLGLVTSVPLSRMTVDTSVVTRHIVFSAWLALAVIGAAAGVFGLAGGSITQALLGPSYGESVGADLGRLVVVLSLWAAISVGVSVTFPLLFVVGGGRRLPLLALATVALQVPLALVGQALLGLDGLALALAATTAFVLVGLLVDLNAARPAGRGLVIATLTIAAFAAASFVPPHFFLGPLAGAAFGLACYAILLLVVRPPALLGAWRYLRAL